MVNLIREICSGDKRRYKENGFNLDLTYILPKVIAMGYPAANFEAVYRNPIQEVARLLNEKHDGKYWIYNLCEEKDYDPSIFQHRVACYPFLDHHPPRLNSMLSFCENVDAWCTRDPDHVAVVHCKAGKGRTGVMICAYLLYSQMCSTPEDALEFYAQKRTKNTHGVTIPSQRRYVHYFSRILREKLQYHSVRMMIRSIRFDGSFLLAPCQIGYRVYVNNKQIYESATFDLLPSQVDFTMMVGDSMTSSHVEVHDDVRIDFSIRRKIEFLQPGLPRHKKKRTFRVCFSTFMLCRSRSFVISPDVSDCNHSTSPDSKQLLCDDVGCSGNYSNHNGHKISPPSSLANDVTTNPSLQHNNHSTPAMYHVLSLNKDELDILSKEKSSKYFSDDFKLILLTECPEHHQSGHFPTNYQDIVPESVTSSGTPTGPSSRPIVIEPHPSHHNQSSPTTDHNEQPTAGGVCGVGTMSIGRHQSSSEDEDEEEESEPSTDESSEAVGGACCSRSAPPPPLATRQKRVSLGGSQDHPPMTTLRPGPQSLEGASGQRVRSISQGRLKSTNNRQPTS